MGASQRRKVLVDILDGIDNVGCERAWWVYQLPVYQICADFTPIVSTFTPIIISDLGFSGLNSLLLVMPAGAVIGTIELTAPFIAMKFKGWRSYLVAITVSGTLLASLLLWLLPQSATGGKLFAVYILASYGGGYAVLMSLVIANSAGYTKRSLGSSGMFVGYCIGESINPSLHHVNMI